LYWVNVWVNILDFISKTNNLAELAAFRGTCQTWGSNGRAKEARSRFDAAQEPNDLLA
jgi:hypothetical protein